MQRIDHAYRFLRYVQLYVGIVNLIDCFIIFSWKLVCITCCIVVGYSAIAHLSYHPVFGVMYYFFILDCLFMYMFTYDRAFQIPAIFQKATRTVMLRALNGGPKSSKIFKRRQQSVPRLGIQVGNFHMMERESSLNFIHHVVVNIVNMLVANRPG